MTKPRVLALGIGAAGAVCAVGAFRTGGAGGWLLAWTAAACGAVAWAYLANRPDLFGKRAGRIPPGRRVALLPYLAAFQLGCWIIARARRLAPLDEVAPGVWVGGRLGPGALPRDAQLVIDLVAELPAHPGVRRLSGYRCLPVLDGHHPHDLGAFLERLDEAAACEGGVVIHCESGVGRAPTAAALLLVARGLVPDPAAAVELMAKRRPRIRPTRSDWDFMARARAQLAARAGRPSGCDGGKRVRTVPRGGDAKGE